MISSSDLAAGSAEALRVKRWGTPCIMPPAVNFLSLQSLSEAGSLSRDNTGMDMFEPPTGRVINDHKKRRGDQSMVNYIHGVQALGKWVQTAAPESAMSLMLLVLPFMCLCCPGVSLGILQLARYSNKFILCISAMDLGLFWPPACTD